MSSRFPISRRTVLRGAGAALALPWLEAMMPSRAKAATQTRRPTRLAAMYIPNGVREDTWTPIGTGRNFKLAPAMEPLEEVKDYLLIPTNLWNPACDFGDGHYVKTSGFLTCTGITKSIGIDVSCNGISMDQVAANSVAHETPLSSLELAIDPVSTGVDTNVGYTRVYGAHIAWAGPTKPLAREINPRLAFERLFRLGQPQADTAERELVLLDRVLADVRKLRNRLGTADRHRMDEYLSSVRSLEERIERAGQADRDWEPRVPLDPALKPEPGIPREHQVHVQLMMDIIALAFQSDTTRVCTFMFGNSVGGKNFGFLDGVSGGHHNISHHQNDPEQLRMYHSVTKWHIEQYGYLLRRLRDMKEGDSNVLDSSMILLGNELRDGNAHSPHNLPLILGGRANGRIASGQHLVFERDTHLSNLYLAMLDAFGAPQDSFADSNCKLPGVLA